MRPNPWFEHGAGPQLGVKYQRCQPCSGLAIGMKTYFFQRMGHDFCQAYAQNGLELSADNKLLNWGVL
jgi:hypothetical protein